jgi:antitoxin CptB
MMRHIVPQTTVREDTDVRCRRLLFRCWHRGTQESDLILGSFAGGSLGSPDSDQLGRLTLHGGDLEAWVQERARPYGCDP